MEKMKTFIKNFATSQASEVSSTTHVMQWIENSFDIESIPHAAIDELVQLAEVAEDKSKIALIDLFRLLILKEEQAEYVLARHWELFEVCIIGYIQAQNLQDTEAKIMQNYHQMSLKLLANVFATAKGRASMRDEERARALIGFCNISFTSCNQKVIIHAALVLFNYLLAFEKESKKNVHAFLELATRGVEAQLKNVELVDKDTIVTLLLCLCRLLYKNHDLTSWVEKSFLELGQTLKALKARTASMSAEVGHAIADVMSMTEFSEDS
uniref:PUL domain-containing protein n=1 Tax=Favella ehrenbergii TaxID=182087 RepID=A0A7S3I6U0_9SPIT|mmetsp:Transcript_36612/g.44727  ORF Transcript_36612/g.44727 Transcript_36612/m.44727 type:complete len:268 (+) Transcript_36612:1283-2086(+)